MSADKLHQTIRYLRRTALNADSNGMADGQLLLCFLNEGEDAAFEILLRRHGRMVLGVCQRILKNSSDAEDAFQATFLVLLRKADSLLDRQTIGNWLYGVAHHVALKARAAAGKRRLKERQAAEARAAELPVEEILWQEWRPLLDQEVQRLPPKYRNLIILCDLEQKSYKEAATLTGCSAGTVAGRLSRARQLLARRLTRYGVQLSVVSLAALLAQNGAAASLPTSLVADAMNAATAATGRAAVAGAISSPVAALTNGVLQAMWMTQLKQLLAVLVLAAGISASALLYQAIAAEPAQTQANAVDDDPSGPRAVIARAIKAHGGAENLSKFKAFSVKWETKRKIENMFYWDSFNVVHYQLPAKVRIDSDVQNPNGIKFSLSTVVSGNNGWRGSKGRSRDIKDSEVNHMLDEMYAHWLASLTPLNDREFEFSPAGQATVDDKEAIGVTVTRKDRPDVNLYFDRKTGLLLKSERRTKDAMTGEEFTAESFYRDYKAFQGVMWATKRLDKRDGKEMDGGAGRFELSDYQALETLDEKLFDRP